jgi:predicted nucleotidyltransferase
MNDKLKIKRFYLFGKMIRGDEKKDFTIVKADYNERLFP